MIAPDGRRDGSKPMLGRLFRIRKTALPCSSGPCDDDEK
jgi:hypothetical protein